MTPDSENTTSSGFFRAGSGITRNLFPGVDLTVNAGPNLMLSIVKFEADAVVPVHQHPHEQAGMLIEGQLQFTIGDRTEILNPGDQWIIPGNTPHTVKAIGGRAVALDVFNPIREDYI